MKLIVTAKSSDLNFISIVNNDGSILREHNGYVPDCLGIGDGDYIQFEVDVDTGVIMDWPGRKAIENWGKETK